jgi:hypothetical protein
MRMWAQACRTIRAGFIEQGAEGAGRWSTTAESAGFDGCGACLVTLIRAGVTCLKVRGRLKGQNTLRYYAGASALSTARCS